MKFGVKVMRLIAPKHERDRREVREAITRASAHAEDLSFTTEKLCNGGLRTVANGLCSIHLRPE